MNTKKINELTMMETVSDAANVLVEENGEAKRIPPGKMVAGSLPEHLQFGETAVGGDTLTWDGNTEGLASVNFGSDAAYKVSDAVFSTEDCVNGVNSSLKLPDTVIQEECVISNFNGVTYVNCGNFPAVYSVPPECVGVDFYGVTFPEAGTYLAKAPFYHCSSLTIPGFGGFPSIKTLDKRYLPEPLQFGEETATVSEPLNITWDGNTEGLVSVSGAFFKVSDLVLTNEQIKSSTIVHNQFGTVVAAEVWGDPNQVAIADDLVMVKFAVFVKKDNVTFDGLGQPTTFPEAGIYLPSANGAFVSSLTTTEPVEKTKTVIKPIDKKYLPGAASCTTFYNAQEDDYIYTDKACSIKASKNDVVEALSRGIIYLCSSENTHSIVGRVSFFDGCAELLVIGITNGNVHAYDYYSAEHIAAGPS